MRVGWPPPSTGSAIPHRRSGWPTKALAHAVKLDLLVDLNWTLCAMPHADR